MTQPPTEGVGRRTQCFSVKTKNLKICVFILVYIFESLYKFHYPATNSFRVIVKNVALK